MRQNIHFSLESNPSINKNRSTLSVGGFRGMEIPIFPVRLGAQLNDHRWSWWRLSGSSRSVLRLAGQTGWVIQH